jgi:hypothetical protein
LERVLFYLQGGIKMAYTKTTWVSNTLISVANLQKIETQYTLFLADLETHIATGHPSLYYTKTLMDSYFWDADNDGSDSTLNADTLGGSHAAAIAGGIPSGFMGWWNPQNGAVPASWLFCDGNSGTYDIRNRFPIGASGTLAAGSAVGNSQITPEGSITVAACTLTVPQIFHIHATTDAYSWQDRKLSGSNSPYICSSVNNETRNTSTAGGGGSHDHPGTFAGDAKALDPFFNYLVIIQRS